MRINLTNAGYHDRGVVKALGARWDAARKVWYIENMEDLTPFMPFMPTKFQVSREAPKKPHNRDKPRTTMSAAAHDCGCTDVPPWEDCVHTWAATEMDEQAESHMRAILRVNT